jgi:hypothetical protein
MSERSDLGGGSGTVSMDVDVEDERTLINVSGQRNAAVIVEGESGERIYLPPEETEHDEEDPYRPKGGADDPYEGIRETDSPYDPVRRSDPSIGMNERPNGFQILHPEPVTDVRLLR